MEELLTMQIGQTINWKFGLISRDVRRVEENLYVITDCSSGWLDADITREQLEQLSKGELSLTELEWY